MNKHQNDYIKEWLGAYLDGELAGDRLAWVEEHLADCAKCQNELAELRQLSALLQADSLPDSLVDEAAFITRVEQRLSRSSQPSSRRWLRASLRFAPLGLFGVWAFSQAVFWVSSALLLSLRLFPQTAGMLAFLTPANGIGASGWMSGIFDMADPLQPYFNLALIEWPGSLVLINLAVITILSILFLAWLAGLFTYRRRAQPQNA
jgi:anti-sigma factor RsiW